jgi:hypothetical protein
MSIDLQNSIQDIKNRVSSIKTTNQVLTDVDDARKKVKDNLEQAEKQVIDAIDKVQEEKKRLKRQVEGQLSQLLQIFQLSSGNGASTVDYVKSKFVRILNRMEPVILPLLKETIVGCVGCSQEQQYTPNNPIYIKISSIDIANQIKNFKPDVDEGKFLYESKPAVLNEFPYSMNREIWDRTQKLGQPFSTDNGSDFVGKSGQPLFDMEYTKINNFGEPGDYLKITLTNRLNNINNVTNFIYDYYSSINVLDLNAVYTRLMELLTGSISFSASLGYGEVEVQNKLSLIIQRILGLCFDARNEIDVSGISKIAELDGIDDSFFEFSNVDLRIIEQNSVNTINGVVEFEDCENIKLPINTQPISNLLSQITFNDGKLDKLDKLADKLANSISNNPEWKLRLPNSFNIDLKVNTDFLLNIPTALAFSLLSPKILLPLFVMLKALGNEASDFIENAVDFLKKFKKCFIKLITKLGAYFIRELFLMLKRDILNLLRRMLSEISKEKIAKKYILIAKLVAILALLVKAFIDWRQCKSVVDEILAVLNVIMMGQPGFNIGIPSILLAAAGGLPGFSAARSLSNVIEELEKSGLPTGAMPDGSPNLYLRAKKAEIDGDQKERANQKGAAWIPPLTAGVFVTKPTSISLLPDI